MTEPSAASKDGLHFQPEWSRVIFASIGDWVITTATQGQVTFLNSVAALVEQVKDFAGVQAYLAHYLLLIIRGGLAPSVAFSITSTVG
jgi:hypothetical protein